MENNSRGVVIIGTVFVLLITVFILNNSSSINKISSIEQFSFSENIMESLEQDVGQENELKPEVIQTKKLAEESILEKTGEYTLDELKEYALMVVNEDRKKFGLAPVELGDNYSAQSHANDMFKTEYFSHWNSQGVKPYVTYTEYGGDAYVQENLAASWCEGLACNINPLDQIKVLEYNMVYNDAESNWGHRDNILDPSHTHVNFGFAFDRHSFYFAQHFENRIINWQTINLDNDGTIILNGSFDDKLKLDSILIFSDPKKVNLDPIQLRKLAPYNQNFYDQGELAGMLLKKPDIFKQYIECSPGKISIKLDNRDDCVAYETFEDSSSVGTIMIKSNVSKWINQEELNTMYIVLQDRDGNNIYATSITLNYL